MDFNIRYCQTLRERLEQLGVLDTVLTEKNEFTYSWLGGGEHQTYKHEFLDQNSGGSDYRGQYHPKGLCEGSGICIHCGRTLF